MNSHKHAPRSPKPSLPPPARHTNRRLSFFGPDLSARLTVGPATATVAAATAAAWAAGGPGQGGSIEHAQRRAQRVRVSSPYHPAAARPARPSLPPPRPGPYRAAVPLHLVGSGDDGDRHDSDYGRSDPDRDPQRRRWLGVVLSLCIVPHTDSACSPYPSSFCCCCTYSAGATAEVVLSGDLVEMGQAVVRTSVQTLTAATITAARSGHLTLHRRLVVDILCFL